MGAPAVRVDDVSKLFRLYKERNNYLKAMVLRGRRARYDEFWALSDVSFDINQGETFGIVGNNGSGKSTLLKCVAGILHPDRGRTSVEGRMSALLELGAGFHPELSGRENVYLNGSILGMKRKEIDAKFNSIVDFADLHAFIDSPVKNYSSGMYVRLGFAVAISVEPDVLLVDEVLAVGDQDFQRKCLDQIAALRDRGSTIVIVSHGLGQVRQMCDRVAWLDRGKLSAVGPAAEVIDRYAGEAFGAAADQVEGQRLGTGEALIQRVEVLDATGQVVPSVHTGDAVRVRLHYEVRQAIVQPVFTVTVRRTDGDVIVSRPSTRTTDIELPPYLGEPGSIDLIIDRLPLLPGRYELGVALGDLGGRVFDDRTHALRFEVLAGAPAEPDGIVTLHGHWALGGGA